MELSRRTRAYFVFVLAIVIAACSGQQRGEAEQEECVRLWLQKKPDLLQRFDENQVKWLCRRTDEWLQAANTPSRPVSDTLTPDQMDYLNRLQCQGEDCLKEIKPRKQKRNPPPAWVPAMVGGQKENSSVSAGGASSGHSDALSDVDAFDSINENSILNEDEDGCAERFWIAQACKFILNATSLEEVFPEEFRRPKISSDLRQKMQQRLENRKAKCGRVKAMLDSKQKVWDDIPNCDGSVFFMTPKQLMERCKEVMEYEKSRSNVFQSAWNFMKKLVVKDGEAQNHGTYGEWLDRCRRLKDRMEGNGTTMKDWMNQFTKKIWPGRRKRDTPAQAVNALHNDLGDLLAVNAADQRAKRKEYRMLSDDERKRYHAAINKLKTDKIGTMSKYDLMVIYHTPSEASGAHWGPAFLPYHREYLKQYEVALRKEDPSVALPYWDTTLDEGLPTPRDSIVWTDDFFGGQEGAVNAGPFAGWITTQELSEVAGMRQLYRSVGSSPFGGLYKQSDIDFMLGKAKYEDLTACVDPTFELVHGIVHMFVGGYMADIGISPNDPCFWMHHNFIDHAWEEFRQSKQTLDQRQKDYPAQDKSCNNFHHADADMKPFPIKNIDGLSNNYTRDIYFYQPRPRCSQPAPNCGSKYLFCDLKAARCLSKVRVSGNCTGFENTDICYNSVCKNGICVADGSATTKPASVTTASTPAGQPTKPAAVATTKAPIQNPTVATPQSVTSTTRRATPAFRPTPSTKPTPVPGQATTTATQSATIPVGPTPATPSIQETTAGQMPTTTGFIATVTSTRAPTVTTVGRVITTRRVPPARVTTPPRNITTARPTRPRPISTPGPTPLPITVPVPPDVTTAMIVEATASLRQTTPASFPVAYIPVTVSRGQGYYSQPVGDAQLKTYGLNIPIGYTQTLDGVQVKDPKYPGYPGAYVAKVHDPDRLGGYANLVKFHMEAADHTGRPCPIQCYHQATKKYGHCPNGDRFKVSPNQQISDPMKYGKTENDALGKLWTNSGGVRQRIPTYVSFQCP